MHSWLESGWSLEHLFFLYYFVCYLCWQVFETMSIFIILQFQPSCYCLAKYLFWDNFHFPNAKNKPKAWDTASGSFFCKISEALRLPLRMIHVGILTFVGLCEVQQNLFCWQLSASSIFSVFQIVLPVPSNCHLLNPSQKHFSISFCSLMWCAGLVFLVWTFMDFTLWY